MTYWCIAQMCVCLFREDAIRKTYESLPALIFSPDSLSSEFFIRGVVDVVLTKHYKSSLCPLRWAFIPNSHLSRVYLL